MTTYDAESRPCGLCKNIGLVRESHIIPAFAVRWLKDTSATGHLRHLQSPDRRVQDGPKTPLLCDACEQRFARHERTFANEIFHPFNADSSIIRRYDEWLLKFCTSVSWRILSMYWGHAGGESVPDLVAARDRWNAYLTSRAPHPGRFRQHILPLLPIGATNLNLPKNINRYLLRALDGELVKNDDGVAMTFAKVGRFAIFGQVSGATSAWGGLTVKRTGVLAANPSGPPPWLFDFLCDRARETQEARDSMSETQKDKIEIAFASNGERAKQSQSVEAMIYDARLFGRSAVVRRK
ncbi:MAG: hypothetical protein DI589_23840 [Shinella sp.]|nr:MAG: hypothetical protein DI589_23840 [Shinella sp.]